MKEQVTYVREHHPMEKEFIVETRPTGRERELTEGRTSEVRWFPLPLQLALAVAPSHCYTTSARWQSMTYKIDVILVSCGGVTFCRSSTLRRRSLRSPLVTPVQELSQLVDTLAAQATTRHVVTVIMSSGTFLADSCLLFCVLPAIVYGTTASHKLNHLLCFLESCNI